MEHLKVRMKGTTLETTADIDFERHQVWYTDCNGIIKNVSEGKFFRDWKLVEPLKEDKEK